MQGDEELLVGIMLAMRHRRDYCCSDLVRLLEKETDGAGLRLMDSDGMAGVKLSGMGLMSST